MVRAPANPPPQLLLRKAPPASASLATDTYSLVISLSLRQAQAQRRRDELPGSCPPPATPPGGERTWPPDRSTPASVQSAYGRGARALLAPGGWHDTWPPAGAFVVVAASTTNWPRRPPPPPGVRPFTSTSVSATTHPSPSTTASSSKLANPTHSCAKGCP